MCEHLDCETCTDVQPYFRAALALHQNARDVERDTEAWAEASPELTAVLGLMRAVNVAAGVLLVMRGVKVPGVRVQPSARPYRLSSAARH